MNTAKLIPLLWFLDWASNWEPVVGPIGKKNTFLFQLFVKSTQCYGQRLVTSCQQLPPRSTCSSLIVKLTLLSRYFGNERGRRYLRKTLIYDGCKVRDWLLAKAGGGGWGEEEGIYQEVIFPILLEQRGEFLCVILSTHIFIVYIHRRQKTKTQTKLKTKQNNNRQMK